MIDRFLYRLAAHLRIPDVESWKRSLTLNQFHKWIAYYRVEPFGEDWLRTAKSTLYVLMALGSKVDEKFIEAFLPSYDPDREMTEDEIKAEIERFTKRQSIG